MRRQVRHTQAGGLVIVQERFDWFPTFSDSPASLPEDLWDCLEQASGKPIAAVMSSWTQQMGFPIIEVDQEQVSTAL